MTTKCKKYMVHSDMTHLKPKSHHTCNNISKGAPFCIKEFDINYLFSKVKGVRV